MTPRERLEIALRAKQQIADAFANGKLMFNGCRRRLSAKEKEKAYWRLGQLIGTIDDLRRELRK